MSENQKSTTLTRVLVSDGKKSRTFWVKRADPKIAIKLAMKKFAERVRGRTILTNIDSLEATILETK